MAKTFIQEGTDSSAILVNAQDEKIPIYATEADAEADLANLEEGQIVGTKESKFEVDDMKQYIRNQNILSDYEEITSTIGRTAATATVMDFDGEILHWCRDVQTEDVYVNGTLIGRQRNLTGTSMAWSFPVKKGDTVYIALVSDSRAFARWYKLRDYSDRQ